MLHEVCQLGGREKLYKWDRDFFVDDFTRMIQIPSFTSLLIKAAWFDPIIDKLRSSRRNIGLLYFDNVNDISGERDQRYDMIKDCVYIIEADVKNFDATVKSNEIIASHSVLRNCYSSSSNKIDKFFVFFNSTLINYNLYANNG